MPRSFVLGGIGQRFLASLPNLLGNLRASWIRGHHQAGSLPEASYDPTAFPHKFVLTSTDLRQRVGVRLEFIQHICPFVRQQVSAEILIHLDDEFGVDAQGVLKISLTREELSNIVGTATESIIRLLSEFKNQGYIQINGRKIKILDKPGLKYIANM